MDPAVFEFAAEPREFRRDIGGQPVVVHCDPALQEAAEWLLGALVQLDAQQKLHDGAQIAFAWIPLRLRQEADALVVEEPHFAQGAVDGANVDLSRTLAVTTAQLELARKAGTQPVRAWFADRVLVEPGCLQETNVYLQRMHDGAEGDSGWYLGLADREARGLPPPTESELEARRVFELFERPHLLQVLALPAGFLAVFEDARLRTLLDPNDNAVAL